VHPLNKTELIQFSLTKRIDHLWIREAQLRSHGWTDTNQWRWITEKIGRMEQYVAELRAQTR